MELFYNDTLSQKNQDALSNALDRYYDIECQVACEMPQCPYARPSDWVTSIGYKSLSDLLDHYDYEHGIAPIKSRSGIDLYRATWARRPGHFNP